MDLKELENGVDPNIHWYYQAKKIPLFRYFNAVFDKEMESITIIDFGAGSGFFSLELLSKFPDKIKKIYLIDIGYTSDEIIKSAGTKVEKHHSIPKGIHSSLVLLMDVIEHIENDLAILKNIKSQLKGNNHYFFLTVPAFESLWSTHDVFLEHYRRYTNRTLKDVLLNAGFRANNVYYIFALIFPLVWVARKTFGKPKQGIIPLRSNMGPTPEPFNSILRAVIQFEMKIFGVSNKIAGLTCVAQGTIN